MKSHKRELAIKVLCGVAREQDFEELGLDEVKAIKSDTGEVHYRFVEHEVKRADEEDERTFEWVASTEHVDSMGDKIMVAGWDLRRLTIGTVPLFLNHNPEPGPAGRLLKGRRGKTADGSRALFLTGRIHEADLYGDSEFGKVLEGHRKLVARGDLLGSSVGFMPKAMHWPDAEEREKNGMPPYGMVFDEQELLEHSITSIPANANANRRSFHASIDSVKALLAAGEIQKDEAELVIANLEASEDAWLRRIARLRPVVPVGRAAPWAKGAAPAATTTGTANEPAVTPALSDPLASIESAALAAIEKVVQAASGAVRREVAAVIREQIEALGASTVLAAERVEEAASRIERAAPSTPNAPKADAEATRIGSQATTAASTGTSRDTPTNPTGPQPSAADALLRAFDAAPRREGPERVAAAAPAGSQGARG